MPADKKNTSPAVSGRSLSLTTAPPIATPPTATQPPAAVEPSAPPLPPDPHTVWQQAHDSLQKALEQGNRSLDQTQGKKQRKLLNQLLDKLSDELTALNQEDIEGHTISLQAASLQLGAGIESLRDLKQQIQQISANIAEAAEIVGAIDSALSGISSLLATFAAV